MAEAKTRSSGRELGEHGGHPVTVRKGRFGPYVKCGKINATLPPNLDMDAITLAEAVVLIDARAAKGPARKKAATARKKSTAKKTPAKKKPAKKTALEAAVE
jgi:DNA topoisomerase-1